MISVIAVHEPERPAPRGRARYTSREMLAVEQRLLATLTITQQIASTVTQNSSGPVDLPRLSPKGVCVLARQGRRDPEPAESHRYKPNARAIAAPST